MFLFHPIAIEPKAEPIGDSVAGVDLGEIHSAAAISPNVLDSVVYHR